MKRILFLFLCVAIQHSTLAQPDKRWVVGTFNVEIEFTPTSYNSISDTEMYFLYADLTASSFFAEQYSLTLHTNSNFVVNSLGDTIANSDCLIDSFDCNTWTTGLPIFQGEIILPRSQNSCYIVSEGITEFAANNYNYLDRLYYSVLDLDVGPHGTITQKKNVLLQDEPLASGKLTACRHANGRDWWVLMKDRFGHHYYFFLATPNNIYLHHEQDIGDSTQNEIYGRAVFNAQGDKLVYTTMVDGGMTQLFDFDRCSGYLSNPKRIRTPYIYWNGDTLHYGYVYPNGMVITDHSLDEMGAMHAAFSPTGQYIYLGNYYSLFQYDITANNIDSTRYLVAKWDSTYLNSQKTVFSQSLLAPNGKIYLDQYGGTCQNLHVINSPDSIGAACNFQHDAAYIPVYASCYPLPNLPSYRPGKIDNSPCDTIINSLHDEQFTRHVLLYPNPTGNVLNVTWPASQSKVQIQLINTLAEILLNETAFPSQSSIQIPVGQYPEGHYLIKLVLNSEIVVTKQCIITK